MFGRTVNQLKLGRMNQMQISFELGKHIAAHESFMQKLGNSLGTTVGHFNNAHKELKKMDKDVIKIADTSAAVDPLLIDRPTSDED